MHFSCAVNSALAGLQKLKEMKDMLGNVEKMIDSFRGGKQSRLVFVHQERNLAYNSAARLLIV